MNKTVLSEVGGFTPVIDAVVEDVGLMTAVVFGRIWRHCQMEDGVCKASLETISSGIGVDKATVMRHAEKLCQRGYLKDLTPDLRNRPHIYADTGKAGLKISIAGVAQSNTKTKTVAESNATVAGVNTGVAESQLNKDFKKDSNKVNNDDKAFEAVKKIYKSEIGALTPIILDFLRDAVTTYPPEWIPEAIQIAVGRNARNWKYVETVLRNAKQQGKSPNLSQPDYQRKDNKGSKVATEPKGFEAGRRFLERQGAQNG